MDNGQLRKDADLLGRYLDEIQRVPLLTREDEVRLGRVILAGQDAAEALAGPGQLAPDEQRRLEVLVQEGERAAQQMIEANLRLVVSVARRYRSAAVPMLDLIQEGNLGLMHAVRRFDHRRGFKFSTIATGWISQAIRRAIATKSRVVRYPLGLDHSLSVLRQAIGNRPAGETHAQWLERVTADTGLTPDQVHLAERYARGVVSLSEPLAGEEHLAVGDVVADPSAEAPLLAVEAAFLAESVRGLLAFLDDREREVLRLRFGLGDCRRHTLDEIGARLDVSRERVRQIETKALARLHRGAIRREIAPDCVSA